MGKQEITYIFGLISRSKLLEKLLEIFSRVVIVTVINTDSEKRPSSAKCPRGLDRAFIIEQPFESLQEVKEHMSSDGHGWNFGKKKIRKTLLTI